jgi:hypothetical protein
VCIRVLWRAGSFSCALLLTLARPAAWRPQCGADDGRHALAQALLTAAVRARQPRGRAVRAHCVRREKRGAARPGAAKERQRLPAADEAADAPLRAADAMRRQGRGAPVFAQGGGGVQPERAAGAKRTQTLAPTRFGFLRASHAPKHSARSRRADAPPPPVVPARARSSSCSAAAWAWRAGRPQAARLRQR